MNRLRNSTSNNHNGGSDKVMRVIATAGVVLCLASAAGCAELNSGLQAFDENLRQLNQKMAVNAKVQAAPSRRRGPEMTPEQVERLHTALAVKTDDRNMVAAINEAAPIIRDFARTEACATQQSYTALNAYAAPGTQFGWWERPMVGMGYHDPSKCLSVVRIHGWRMLARNAFEFEIAYIADDSGDARATPHELVKQPSGEWLFRR